MGTKARKSKGARARRVSKTTERSIVEQRQRLVVAMSMVATTAFTLDMDFRRETLTEAHRIIGDVASELNRIGGAP